MSNFRHVAPAPALASSTPDRACTTDLVAHIHISARGNQDLDHVEKLLHDREHEQGSTILTWGE